MQEILTNANYCSDSSAAHRLRRHEDFCSSNAELDPVSAGRTRKAALGCRELHLPHFLRRALGRGCGGGKSQGRREGGTNKTHAARDDELLTRRGWQLLSDRSTVLLSLSKRVTCVSSAPAVSPRCSSAPNHARVNLPKHLLLRPFQGDGARP